MFCKELFNFYKPLKIWNHKRVQGRKGIINSSATQETTFNILVYVSFSLCITYICICIYVSVCKCACTCVSYTQILQSTYISLRHICPSKLELTLLQFCNFFLPLIMYCEHFFFEGKKNKHFTWSKNKKPPVHSSMTIHDSLQFNT